MPRAEFTNMKDLRTWLQALSKRRFVAYKTKFDELVIQPTTSTAPVTYAYMEKTVESIEEMMEEFDIPIINIKRWEWSSENQVKRD